MPKHLPFIALGLFLAACGQPVGTQVNLTSDYAARPELQDP